MNKLADFGSRTIRNDSGADVSRFEILKIGDPLYTPTDSETGWANRQTFKTDTPTDDAAFCVALRDIPNGETGPALFAGCTPCKIDVTNADHTHAKAGTTITALNSGIYGQARILWKEAGTGEKWAFITFVEGVAGGMILGTANAAFSDADSTFAMTVTDSKVSGIDNSDTVTVRNRIKHTGSSGKNCLVWIYPDGTNDLVNAECA